MELYQAEWCPHSHNVRQRLTELGLDFTAKQVPADPGERDDLRKLVGDTEIPVLILDDGSAFLGEDEILGHLAGRIEPSDAEAHRAKAREEVPTFAEAHQASIVGTSEEPSRQLLR
jgi:glutathione S-transferase